MLLITQQCRMCRVAISLLGHSGVQSGLDRGIGDCPVVRPVTDGNIDCSLLAIRNFNLGAAPNGQWPLKPAKLLEAVPKHS